MTSVRPLADLISQMESMLAPLQAAGDERAYFLGTYTRTTKAVAGALVDGLFADPEWVERWDEEFAGLYLDAVDSWTTTGTAPGPWAVAFAKNEGEERLPPLRHVLLGINAHINFDLPQALLDVISDEGFQDPGVIAMRQVDHERIDTILADRVAAEDRELRKVEQPGDRTLLDLLLVPFNRRASNRFLAEARAKVWANAVLLNQARRYGTLAARLIELEELTTRRVADLRAPGQVIFRLARDGFGVTLPPGPDSQTDSHLASEGKPMDIILIPGLWLDGSTWDKVTPMLEKAGHSTHALTLPGLESKDADRSTITRQDQVDAVVAAIDSAGNDPVVLVGHSAGAAIAYAAIDARPDRVARAIYISGFPLGDGEADPGGFASQDGEIPLPDWSDFDEDDLSGLDEAALSDFRERAIPSPAGAALDPQRLSDERRYDVPVTMICNEFSSEVLQGWIERDLSPVREFTKIRDLTYVDLPTGHWPQFSKPTELAEVILGAVSGRLK